MNKLLPQGVTKRLILVRHGEPSAEAKGVCYGKFDVGLSERGKRQIEKTDEYLQNFKVSSVYASPRARAIESAKLIAGKCGLSFQICESFCEIDFGDFEKRSYREIEEKFPDIFAKWMKTPTEVEFPNGESFAQMQARVLDGLNGILQKHTGETTAIVSHGGVNRIILAHFLQIKNADIFRLGQDYACVNIIDFYEDFPLIKILNYNGN
ncbi:MAG: alpha-ribazole phosphatase [Pyrinomonadaceae bacterium]